MTLEQLEKSVSELDPKDFAAFAAWFEILRAERWDIEIETDTASGKLDRFGDEALAEFRARKREQP